MKNLKYIPYWLFFGVLIGAFMYSCTYKKLGEDLDIFVLAKSTTNYVWYKNSDVLLTKSIGTGHKQPFLRTRYNDIAANNLDAQFKVKSGSNFAEGSMIVKELFDSGKLELYAILYKKTSHPNADRKGWVWGYIYADGSVNIASSKKGTDCIGCHSQNNNEDYGLMNKFFP